jgi:hypothetical protein
MQRINVAQPIVYTALFDLSRDVVDGRSINDYKSWLVRTCALFPGLTVFHDGCCDDLDLEDVKFHRIKPSDLKFFQFLEPVSVILKSYLPDSPNDVTFRLPSYSLMQFSKFELGCLLLKDLEGGSVLWVDAGISRFFNKSQIQNGSLMAFTPILNEFDLILEIDLRKNLKLLKMRIKESRIGSCRRIISGTSFWANHKAINELYQKSISTASEWIESGIWDNEQVMLRNIISKLDLKTAFVIQGKKDTGSVARFSFNSSLLFLNLKSKVIGFFLRK